MSMTSWSCQRANGCVPAAASAVAQPLGHLDDVEPPARHRVGGLGERLAAAGARPRPRSGSARPRPSRRAVPCAPPRRCARSPAVMSSVAGSRIANSSSTPIVKSSAGVERRPRRLERLERIGDLGRLPHGGGRYPQRQLRRAQAAWCTSRRAVVRSRTVNAVPWPSSLLDCDGAPVRVDDALRDGEAEAGARDRLLGGAAGPEEPLEQPPEVVLGDADSGVLDDELGHRRRDSASADRDPAALGRELDGVGEQVGDHLPEPVGVGGDLRPCASGSCMSISLTALQQGGTLHLDGARARARAGRTSRTAWRACRSRGPRASAGRRSASAADGRSWSMMSEELALDLGQIADLAR